MPYYRHCAADGIDRYQQDGCPAHTAVRTMERLQELVGLHVVCAHTVLPCTGHKYYPTATLAAVLTRRRAYGLLRPWCTKSTRLSNADQR
jgi:hypothetical protein